MLVTLLALSSVVPIYAITTQMSLSTPKTNVKRGEKIFIKFGTLNTADVVGGFNGFSGTVIYDSAVISNGKPKSSVADWQFTYSPAKNTMVGYDGSGVDFKKADTELVVFEIDILPNAPLGNTVFKVNKNAISDSKFKNITLPEATIILNVVDAEVVIPPKSAVSSLDGLVLKDGSGTNVPLSPSFSKGNKSYTASVGEAVNTIDVSALLSDSKASIVSGNGNQTLLPGKNTINVVVRAENGTETTYTVVVDKAVKKPEGNTGGDSGIKSSVNTLDELKLKDSTGKIINLSPSFSKENKSYTATVSKDVNEIDISGLLTDPNSTIISGSGKQTLKPGKNTITVEVKAQNGTISSYTIVIDKPLDNVDSETPGGDKPGGNTPGGDKPGSNNPGGDKPDTNNPGQDIPGSDKPSGDKPGVNNPGSNNGSVQNPNGITINNSNNNTSSSNNSNSSNSNSSNNNSNSSSNNFVSDLKGFGNLDKPFDKNITQYFSQVGKETTKLDIKIDLEDTRARYTIKGADNLQIGLNDVFIEVEAANGDKKVYCIQVERTEEESGSLLSNMNVGGYAFNPGFREDQMFYTLVVPENVETLGVSATPKHGGASVNVAGNQKLHHGLNYVKVAVSANGQMNTYIVEVVREQAGPVMDWIPWIISGVGGIIILFLLMLLALKSKQTVIQNPSQAQYYQAPPYPYYPVYPGTASPGYPGPTNQGEPYQQSQSNHSPNYFKQRDNNNGEKEYFNGGMNNSSVNAPYMDLPKETDKNDSNDEDVYSMMRSHDVDHVTKEIKFYTNVLHEGKLIEKEYKVIQTFRKGNYEENL